MSAPLSMPPESRPPLVVRGLTKRYPGADQAAVDHLDLTVDRGEIYGLLGPNGAGKTTTISMLSTLLRPSAGRIFICGHDALQNPRAVRPLIGLVPQDIALYAQLSARENLQYFGRLFGLRGARLARRVARSLDMVGLSDAADRRVAAFSGGMKRRVNLAAGILNAPRLLFLDEPTVGIDAHSRNLILEQLAVLARSGTTLIYTTHYMEEAEALCSRVAVVDRGAVVAEGNPAELVQSCADAGNLGELFLNLTGKQLRDD